MNNKYGYMPNLSDTASIVQEMSNKIAKATEESILEQLNDFVSRGLIEVQLTQPILVQEPDSAKITIRQSCRLVLKDKEYIEKLEKENAELKASANTIIEHMNRLSDKTGILFQVIK